MSKQSAQELEEKAAYWRPTLTPGKEAELDGYSFTPEEFQAYKQAIREEVINDPEPFLPKIYTSKQEYLEDLLMSFHLEQGLHFNRTASGGVRIVKYKESSPENEVEFEVIIDAESWASVILSASAKEEDGDSFQEALDFHMDNN